MHFLKFCMVLLAVMSFVETNAFNVGNLSYSISNGEATVTGAVNRDVKEIVIPATVVYKNKEYNVTTVGTNAFQGCKSVTRLVIEDSALPLHGVWYTDKHGWQVRSFPFQDCPLKTIYLGRDTSTVGGDNIYNGLSLSNSGKLVEVTVGGNSTQINSDTFGNVDLSVVTIKSSLQTVRTKTFKGQKNLRKLVVESGDTELSFADSDAFPDCPLDSVILNRTFANLCGIYSNKNVRHITLGAPVVRKHMTDCPNVESYRILPECNTVEFGNLSSTRHTLKNVVIEDCENPLDVDGISAYVLDSIYIGRGLNPEFIRGFHARKVETGPYVNAIPNLFCYHNDETETVILHENVESLGRRAFQYCEKLKSIHLPDNIRSIGEEAFEECKMLEHINIPANLQEIPESMLKGCVSLKDDIIIKPHIKRIAPRSFERCKFDNFIIEDDDEPITFGETSPFYSASIKHLYFGRQPVKDKSGYEMLSGDIDTLELGSKVHEVFHNFGIGNSKVKHLILSENIKEIAHFMFHGCDSLQTIVCKSETPAFLQEKNSSQLSKKNFSDVTVTVPIGSKRTYQSDKLWGKFQHIRSDKYFVRASYDSHQGSITVNGTEIASLDSDNPEGIFETLIPEGAPVSIEITPFEGYALNSIEMDGEPLVGESNMYTIESIDNDHDLNVSFNNQWSLIPEISSGDGTAWIQINGKFITIPDGNDVCLIYDMNGLLLKEAKPGESLSLPQGIYLVKSGEKVQKLAIN